MVVKKDIERRSLFGARSASIIRDRLSRSFICRDADNHFIGSTRTLRDAVNVCAQEHAFYILDGTRRRTPNIYRDAGVFVGHSIIYKRIQARDARRASTSGIDYLEFERRKNARNDGTEADEIVRIQEERIARVACENIDVETARNKARDNIRKREEHRRASKSADARRRSWRRTA